MSNESHGDGEQEDSPRSRRAGADIRYKSQFDGDDKKKEGKVSEISNWKTRRKRTLDLNQPHNSPEPA